MAHGTSVTAKISWLTNTAPNTTGERSRLEGKPRWIHCTPMLGSDEKVGVWMIVMVEHEEVTGQLNRARGGINANDYVNPGSPRTNGAADTRFTSDKLYQEYLRREGRSETASQPSRHGSERDGGRAQEHFKDF